MSGIQQLSSEEESFLRPYLPSHQTRSPQSTAEGDVVKPFVTLTYACSLDGMISLSPGVRTTLSGIETKSMTHYLRLHHDAILVGVGTATADDPSLNCRYPGPSSDTAIQPVVLDPSLRWNMAGSNVATLAKEGNGKAPWVIHAAGARSAYPPMPKEQLLVIHDEHRELTSGRLKWHSVLKAIARKGVQSVMIEGGATVINELLAKSELVDSIIVTIAPTWLGQGGVSVTPEARVQNGVRVNAARLHETSWRQFGQDAVLCGRLS